MRRLPRLVLVGAIWGAGFWSLGATILFAVDESKWWLLVLAALVSIVVLFVFAVLISLLFFEEQSVWPWTGLRIGVQRRVRRVESAGTFYSHEPIVAYKTVNSAAFRDYQEPSVYEARCFGSSSGQRLEKHGDVPELRCTCGFYAWKPENVPEHVGPMRRVELFGKVIEHERGYRAQKMIVIPGGTL